MPKPYSDDLRERVIEAVVAGASRREAAESFSLSASSAVRWLQRWRDSGSTRAKLSGGSTSPLEEQVEWLLALVAEQPDLTLDEIVAAMRKQRIPGSRTAVWRFFERHNVTVKKKPARERGNGGRGAGAAAALNFASKGLLDAARLVFIDETATSTSLVRLHSPQGERIWSGPFQRPLEAHHPGCRTAPRRHGRSLRDRSSHRRDNLPRIHQNDV